MNRITVNVVKKTETVDELGKVTGKSWATVRTAKTNYLLPFSTNSALKTYGLNVETTHRTQTYEHFNVGEYIQDNKNTYLIQEITGHIRVKELLLKKVV